MAERLAPRAALGCTHAAQVPMFSASGMRVAYMKIMERRMGAAYKVHGQRWVLHAWGARWSLGASTCSVV